MQKNEKNGSLPCPFNNYITTPEQRNVCNKYRTQQQTQQTFLEHNLFLSHSNVDKFEKIFFDHRIL